MERTADAVWRGTGREGSGVLTTQSGALREVPYSFGMRFGDDKGTNPEELIGAAHAGCYAMALAVALGEAGRTPDELRTHAAVTLERTAAGFTVTKIHLTLRGRVPGIAAEEFRAMADEAKANCPISRLLKAQITLDAALEG